jgi:Protein of unknown function (DUF1656)
MIGEINIGGVFIPSIVIWVVIALMLLFVIRRYLARQGFYGYVWHQMLFNTALFVIILGSIVLIINMVLLWASNL